MARQPAEPAPARGHVVRRGLLHRNITIDLVVRAGLSQPAQQSDRGARMVVGSGQAGQRGSLVVRWPGSAALCSGVGVMVVSRRPRRATLTALSKRLAPLGSRRSNAQAIDPSGFKLNGRNCSVSSCGRCLISNQASRQTRPIAGRHARRRHRLGRAGSARPCPDRRRRPAARQPPGGSLVAGVGPGAQAIASRGIDDGAASQR
jgi:hypothetical protein